MLLQLRKGGGTLEGQGLFRIEGQARAAGRLFFEQELSPQVAAQLAPSIIRGGVWNLGLKYTKEFRDAGGASDSVRLDTAKKFSDALVNVQLVVQKIILPSALSVEGAKAEMERAAVEAGTEYKPKLEVKEAVQRRARSSAAKAAGAAATAARTAATAARTAAAAAKKGKEEKGKAEKGKESKGKEKEKEKEGTRRKVSATSQLKPSPSKPQGGSAAKRGKPAEEGDQPLGAEGQFLSGLVGVAMSQGASRMQIAAAQGALGVSTLAQGLGGVTPLPSPSEVSAPSLVYLGGGDAPLSEAGSLASQSQEDIKALKEELQKLQLEVNDEEKWNWGHQVTIR